jgi:signal transduction histidine kinase
MLYNKLTGSAAGFLDLRMIAHDMRAPLHALNLSVHAARRQNHNPEAVATLLELAERNIRVLSSLVENMLAADSGTGKEQLVLRDCEAHEIVMRALDQVSALAAEKEQRLEAAEMLALPPLVADADGLVRVLVNLLANAIKFTSTGGSIQVSVKLRINDGHRVLVFSVADDGVGVAPDQIDRIFLEGISLAVTGKHSTGLGLAVCRAIVEAHGGRIWVEAGRSRGARFSFSIPTDSPPCRRPDGVASAEPVSGFSSEVAEG